MAESIGVKPSTFRYWCARRTQILEPVKVVDGKLIEAVKKVTPPRIQSCGRDATDRKVYRVTDAEQVRDALRKASS